MHLNNKIITGISLIICGGIAYLARTGIVSFSELEVIGTTLIIYGILSVYISLSNGNRDRLFLSAVLFLVGIIFIVEFNFELKDSRGLTFVSILFVGGAAFLVLFFENTKEKIFLAAALLLMLLGFISTNILKQTGILTTANKLADLVEMFWPAILIFLGLSTFLTRKK